LLRAGVAQSKSELMRLFTQGGVHDFETDEVLGRDDRVRAGTIRVGKKNFFKVAVK
jgi:tyrosyl-tRNA synthetase